MLKKQNNYAFIDSQNVNLGIRNLGWILDFRKFRIYLKEKYGVGRAYLFLGYLKENKGLYEFLWKAGYVLVFKELNLRSGSLIKGNCDAELVLQVMDDYNSYAKAVVVSGDGDFTCLIRYLNRRGKLERLLVPNRKRHSALLREAAEGKVDFMNNLKRQLKYMSKRTP